ncbi:MAG TPA: hypothetical protein VIN73_12410 [Vicingaceae bacterium]
MKKELIKKLEELSLSDEVFLISESHPYFGLKSQSENKLIEECIELISKIKTYQIFNEHLQLLGGSSMIVSYGQLLTWLYLQTKKSSAKQAIKILDDYIKSDSFEAEQIELVAQTLSDSEWEFCNGVRFAEPYNICDSFLAAQLIHEKYSGSFAPHPRVTAILAYKFDHPIFHMPSKVDEQKEKWPKVNIPFNQIKLTRLLLSLAKPAEYGIHSIAQTTVAPDDTPIVTYSRSWSTLPSFKPPLGPSILEIEFRRADEFIKSFDKLSEEFQHRLLISLDKLNDYGSGNLLENRAIDLRVCIESIFLADGNKEQLRYRVSLRAALLLGKSTEEKHEIFNTIKSAYDITSTVIHNGKFSKSNDLKLLKSAAEYCRKAIVYLITNGPVDWQSLEFGEKLAITND